MDNLTIADINEIFAHIAGNYKVSDLFNKSLAIKYCLESVIVADITPIHIRPDTEINIFYNHQSNRQVSLIIAGHIGPLVDQLYDADYNWKTYFKLFCKRIELTATYDDIVLFQDKDKLYVIKIKDLKIDFTKSRLRKHGTVVISCLVQELVIDVQKFQQMLQKCYN